MKKRIFTTLAIFAALALTACGGAQPASEAGKSSGKPAGSSKHVHVAADDAPWVSNDTQHWKECKDGDGGKVDAKSHTWVKDDSKTDTVSTCSVAGIAYEKCEVCGKTRERQLDLAEHTYGEWVIDGNAKCGEAGSRSRECTVCHHPETETLGIIPHEWDLDNAQTVAASGDGVEYTTAVCKKCNATGYFVAAAKATLSSGASKKTAPEGCVKMSPDGATMTVAFNLDAAKTGIFWLRGAMDYWYEDSNNNQNKTYYSENSNHTDASTKTGNFKLEVGPDVDNLTNVELPDDTSLTFGQMLPETVGSNEGGHQWSVIGDCIVGAASLSAGLNTIRFTRVDSYNLAVHDFLFVVPAAA